MADSFWVCLWERHWCRNQQGHGGVVGLNTGLFLGFLSVFSDAVSLSYPVRTMCCVFMWISPFFSGKPFHVRWRALKELASECSLRTLSVAAEGSGNPPEMGKRAEHKPQEKLHTWNRSNLSALSADGQRLSKRAAFALLAGGCQVDLWPCPQLHRPPSGEVKLLDASLHLRHLPAWGTDIVSKSQCEQVLYIKYADIYTEVSSMF